MCLVHVVYLYRTCKLTLYSVIFHFLMVIDSEKLPESVTGSQDTKEPIHLQLNYPAVYPVSKLLRTIAIIVDEWHNVCHWLFVHWHAYFQASAHTHTHSLAPLSCCCCS